MIQGIGIHKTHMPIQTNDQGIEAIVLYMLIDGNKDQTVTYTSVLRLATAVCSQLLSVH